jgi:hypothetical protein
MSRLLEKVHRGEHGDMSSSHRDIHTHVIESEKVVWAKRADDAHLAEVQESEWLRGLNAGSNHNRVINPLRLGCSAPARTAFPSQFVTH